MFRSAYTLVTHIHNFRKATTTFCDLKRQGMLDTCDHPDRYSPMEEGEEVDWHQKDVSGVPGFETPDKSPTPSTCVLEFKVLLTPRW